MNDKAGHLDDEQLLLSLYDAAAPETTAHLGACPECAARLRRLQARRSAWLATPAPPVDPARLRAQRDAIYEAIEKKRARPYWRALQAGALACSVLLGVLLYRPAPPPVQTVRQPLVTDQELFNDLADMINRETPIAAEPLMALFTPQESQESQQP